MYFSFASSFACRSSRLCFITWKRLVEDYLALAFCIFHSLCWLLSVLEELVSLRGSDLRKHSFAPPELAARLPWEDGGECNL